MNVMQHCQILSIGDCSKAEARSYFEEVLLPHVPEKFRGGISFEELYKVFGGKLTHLTDYSALSSLFAAMLDAYLVVCIPQ
jgi:hypothetical protein